MTIQTVKASDIDQQKTSYNFVIVGESGSGKTHSIMTFPNDWKVLVLDMFGNKETYAGDSNIEVISFSDLDPGAASAWPKVQEVKRQLLSMLNAGTFPWDALVVDTITGLTRFIENYTLMTMPEGKGVGGSPAMHHYRGMSHMTGQFITSFLAYPVVNVLICHVNPPESEGQIAHKALLVGKTWRNSIYSYVHEVYHAYAHNYKDGDKENTQWVWQTQPDLPWPMLKSVLARGGKYFGKLTEQNFSKLLLKRGLISKDQVKEPVL